MVDSKTIGLLIVGLVIGAGVGYTFSGDTNDGASLDINDYNQLQSQYNALLEENNEIINEKNQLQTLVNTKETTIQTLQNTVSAKESEVSVLKSEIDELMELLPPLPPEEGEPGSSRHFPAGLNTEITYSFQDWLKPYTGTVTLVDFIRGNQAWIMLEEANSVWNDPPPEGFEYILTKVSFKLLSVPSDEEDYSLSEMNFEVVSADGVVYDYELFLIEPTPDITADLYPGATHTGWIAFMVDESDLEPLLVFRRDHGGAWFKIYS